MVWLQKTEIRSRSNIRERAEPEFTIDRTTVVLYMLELLKSKPNKKTILPISSHFKPATRKSHCSIRQMVQAY